MTSLPLSQFPFPAWRAAFSVVAVAVSLGCALPAASWAEAGATGKAPTPAPATRAATSDAPVGEWQLADALLTRLKGKWIASRGAYGGAGNISIRQNAMLLELHALAAERGHVGPARNDANADALVRFLTAPPVLVLRTHRRRETGIFPHTPAFEGVYTRNSSNAALHPSADAIVIRALAAAWEARDQLGLPAATREQLQHAVGAVATGAFYRLGRRAENQINWNAEVLMADAVVNGRRASLGRYRQQLLWFAEHMVKPYAKGGSPNVSAGGAFRYSPQFKPTEGANRWHTVEYANLVHGALGFYGEAVGLGMRPLPPGAKSRLQRWSKQIAYGTWTSAGYLNWDTGLSTKRRHLRQYWGLALDALALDALVRGAQPGGLVGDTMERAWVSHVAKAGVQLFARTAWDGTGTLPGPTSFGAPNGFPAATDNDYMAPLRFATVAVLLRRSLDDVQSVSPGLIVSDDRTTGRLAFTTPIYNGAIVREGPGPEGGLEPTRLFDGLQRPLTLLGSDGFAGPSPGLRITAGGKAIADTQPGHDHGRPLAFVSVRPDRRNRTARYSTFTAGGTVGKGKQRITVLHLFGRASLRTRYLLHGANGRRLTVRMPVWSDLSDVTFNAGAQPLVSGAWLRTHGRLTLAAKTPAGARMTVTYTGIPTRAEIRIFRFTPTPRAPAGVTEVMIRMSSTGVREIEREINVDPALPAS